MRERAARRVFESPADGHFFFGYFDTPQVSADETKILALKCERIDRVPDGQDVAEVGFFDMASRQFHKIGETTAYNWQQGCMLQFLGPDYNQRVIFNRFDGERYVAEIVDLVSGERRTVPAVYGLFPDGRRALTIDFARHYWCRRGYSYGNIVDPRRNQPVVAGDGIWSIDIESGASRRLIAIEDMLRLQPVDSMRGATHYLEHMTANPSGSHFAFLHRWRYPEGIHSRLLVADAEGGDVRVLNDSGRMSHYCWRDDGRLIGYGGLPNAVNKLRRHRALIKSVFRYLLPLYHRLVRDHSTLAKTLTGDAYLEFDRSTGRARMVAGALRSQDGHPSMLAGGHGFITDTYARSKFGARPRLYLYDLRTDEAAVLDELGSIDVHDETPLRCDLHPRVSPSGAIVSVDTMDRGVRGVYAYRLDGALARPATAG